MEEFCFGGEESDTIEDRELIPGLTDDMAQLCLARLPRVVHSSKSLVCKSWRSVFRSEALFKLRASLKIEEPWSLLVKEDGGFMFPEFIERHTGPSLYCAIFDWNSHMICRIPHLTVRSDLSKFQCTEIGHEFLVLGGIVATTVVKSMNIFDTLTHKWYVGADMLVPRHGFCFGEIDGKLYVLGGSNNTSLQLMTGEVYDPKTKGWSMIAPIPDILKKITTYTVFQGRFYISGEIPLQDSEVRAFLCYDPVTNSWENIRKLGLNRGQFIITDESLIWYSKCPPSLYDEEKFRTPPLYKDYSHIVNVTVLVSKGQADG